MTDIRRELTTYVLRDFAVDGKLDYMDEYVLRDERDEILHNVRQAAACLEMANNIEPLNTRELFERRLYQDKAIGYLCRIEQELDFIIDTLGKKINVNKYMASVDMIEKEVSLIRKWRSSDDKRYSNLSDKIG